MLVHVFKFFVMFGVFRCVDVVFNFFCMFGAFWCGVFRFSSCLVLWCGVLKFSSLDAFRCYVGGVFKFS